MRAILFLNLLFCFTTIFGQPTANDSCYTNTNVKTKATLQTYPFNQTDRILIVNYKAAVVQGKPNMFNWDTVQIIPKAAGVIDTSKFLSKKQLSKGGIDSLLRIINQRSKDNIIMEGAYVEPSNAILFIDKSGNVFEYIVICFSQIGTLRHYSEMSSSHSKVTLGGWCKEKGGLLTNFFLQRGVDIVVSKWE